MSGAVQAVVFDRGATLTPRHTIDLAEQWRVCALAHPAHAHAACRESREPHTLLDPDDPPLWEALRDRGIRIGVLFNTPWSREYHDSIFRRGGVLHLVDGAVYSSEIDVAKPHPDAFGAALASVQVTVPSQAVVVGDRPFEDVHGAQQVGMRAVDRWSS